MHAAQSGSYNVQLIGDPTVAATQSGNCYTHLVGVSPVIVQNGAGSPIPVQEQTSSLVNSWSLNEQLTEIPDGSDLGTQTDMYTVPPGFKLIVNTISIASTADNGNFAQYAVVTAEGSYVYLPIVATGNGSDAVGTLTGNPLLVVDAGYTVAFNASQNHSNVSGLAYVACTIAGCLFPDANPPKRAPGRKRQSQNPATLCPRPIPFRKREKKQPVDRSDRRERRERRETGPLTSDAPVTFGHPAIALRGFCDCLESLKVSFGSSSSIVRWESDHSQRAALSLSGSRRTPALPACSREP